MPTQHGTPADLPELEAAFAAFNRVSGQLQDSYTELQAQVERLEAQLDEANRRNADEARRNAELASRLAALLEALPGGVVMLDSDGVIRELNATATDFLGLPLQDVAWSEVRGRAFHKQSCAEGDLVLHDGRTLNLAQKLMNPGPGRVLLFTDVSEHRKVQELLARHRRLAAMGEMAAALAHQIRTPLSAALLYTENAGRSELPEPKRNELLTKASRCLHDIEQLIADMLQFARGACIAESRIEVDELLSAVHTAAAGLTGPGQSIELPADAHEAFITGNREALTGAILNLISNALQHGGPDAQVRVDVRTAHDRFELRVKDNGPGVAVEHRDRIFEPFFTSRPDGTGLGLAVVRSVARAHGGDVILENTAQPGACFLLSLPLQASGALHRDTANDNPASREVAA